MALFRMAFFRLFALVFRHFAWRISFFRLFAWRYFVFSLFRLAFFRYFVFSLGVISSWRRAITPGEKTKERNNEMAQTSHHTFAPLTNSIPRYMCNSPSVASQCLHIARQDFRKSRKDLHLFSCLNQFLLCKSIFAYEPHSPCFEMPHGYLTSSINSLANTKCCLAHIVSLSNFGTRDSCPYPHVGIGNSEKIQNYFMGYIENKNNKNKSWI